MMIHSLIIINVSSRAHTWNIRFDVALSQPRKYLSTLSFIKLAGDPLMVPTKGSDTTVVSIRFASPTLTTKQEEMAYSFQTLIADFGGLLGLFVGFNFLMIWDGVVLALKCLKTKTKL